MAAPPKWPIGADFRMGAGSQIGSKSVGGQFASAMMVRQATYVTPSGGRVTYRSRFPEIILGLEVQCRVASRASAERIRDDAEERAPTGTREFVDPETGEQHPGLLKESLYVDGMDLNEDWAVASDLRYAPMVEFGTSDTPAQPFLIPAMEAERGPFINTMVAGIAKL